jgi:hypothetical protein
MAEHSPSPADAYPVRGHRLRLFIPLARGICTPAENATRQIAFMRRRRDEHINDPAYAYYVDAIGPDAASVRRAWMIHTDVFQRFVDLDDRALVKIVAGQRDGICGSTAVGAHCTLRTSMRWGDDLATRDVTHMQVFADAAQALGYELSHISEHVVFDDAPPADLPALLTTRGIAGAVLASPIFSQQLAAAIESSTQLP